MNPLTEKIPLRDLVKLFENRNNIWKMNLYVREEEDGSSQIEMERIFTSLLESHSLYFKDVILNPEVFKKFKKIRGGKYGGDVYELQKTYYHKVWRNADGSPREITRTMNIFMNIDDINIKDRI